VWTLYALAVTAALGFLLSIHGIWSLQHRNRGSSGA
jgi:hypothetical protein